MAAIIAFDRRTRTIHVPRASLSDASENALAASRNALDAIERAQRHIWSGHRSGAIHELGRVGFELTARLEALTALTNLADSASACPDKEALPGHGSAA